MNQTTPIPSHVRSELVHHFDLKNPTGYESDYHLAVNRLHEAGVPDIFWTPCNGGHWVATRGEDIQQIFKDYEKFSSRKLVVPIENNPSTPLYPIMADPPAHTRYRALISPAFTPKAIAVLEENARALAVRLIEELRPKGECEFVGDFALHLPIGIFLKMVDLPGEDRLQLIALVDEMQRLDGRPKDAVVADQMNYLKAVLDERRSRPGNDLLSHIVRSKVEGRDLSEAEALGICVLLLNGGLDTVASMMGFFANFLATHSEHRRKLIEDPGLIPDAVEEMLRRFALTNPGRMVAHDMHYKGIFMKSGDMIVLPTCLHGLDDRLFRDPLEVDFERGNTLNSTFGNGPHRCPGSYLARVELKIFLQEWLQRIPEFALKPDAKPLIRAGVNGSFHYLPLVWDNR